MRENRDETDKDLISNEIGWFILPDPDGEGEGEGHI